MKINNDNFVLYACKAYTGHIINQKEFDKDLKKIGQISRFLTRYDNGHNVNLKMLINLVVTFFNVFQLEIGIELMIFKLPEKIVNKFCTILFFLDRLPVKINNEYKPKLDYRFLEELEECIKC